MILGPLKDIGLLPESFRLLATPIAVIAGITYNFLPFMTLPLYVALEKVPISILEASADLYAGTAARFWRVTFPMALPGVVAGSLLTFIPAVGDFVNAELLGNPKSQMIGNVIQAKFLKATDYPAGAAAVVHAHVRDPGRGAHLRPPGRHRAAVRGKGLMAVTPVAPATSSADLRRPSGTPWKRFRRFISRWSLPVYAFVAVVYLALPVLVMIAFSFNDPAGRANLAWGGFSIDAWLNPLGPVGLGDAVLRSLVIAALSTLVATTIGLLMALALVRHSFRGRAATNLLVFLPMSTPEIVLGTSLLTLFITTTQWSVHPQGHPVSPGHAHDPHRPRHVQHQLRRGDRAGAPAGASPATWKRPLATCTRTTGRRSGR